MQLQLIWINFITWKCRAMNKNRMWAQNSLGQTCLSLPLLKTFSSGGVFYIFDG